MCEQTEIPYRDGDVVWVKLGKCFWPGQVRDIEKLEDDILESFKKKPIAAVQFFDEDKYEFVKNLDQISLYNGRKKMDFIKKGLDMFQKQKASSTFMNKFPEDVKKAELLTGGDPNILSDPHFSPKEKTSYHGLFDTNVKSSKKDKLKLHSSPRTPKPSVSSSTNGRRSLPAAAVRTPPRPITHPRFVRGETDHEVRIRDQQTVAPSTPDACEAPAKSKANDPYKCQLCDFTSNRLNVIVLHNKFHSGDAATLQNSTKGSGSKGKVTKPKSSLTPSPAARPRGRPKGKTKVTFEEVEPVPKTTTPVSSVPKPSTPTKAGLKRKILEVDNNTEKTDEEIVQKTKVKTKESPDKRIQKTPEKLNEKRSPKSTVLGKRKGVSNADKAAKKSKSDEEIRDKLLADWDDEDAEQEEREVELLKKKPDADTTVASCFDFDDSKDAILGTELEERAKKFVEGRKIPRLADDKPDRTSVEGDADATQRPEVHSAENGSTKADAAANAEDFDKAIDSLLEETRVPSLPVVPNSSGTLPDIVLDSNVTVENNNKQEAFTSVDHDYSARRTIEGEAYDDIMDINSMPVVMTDDIVTEEATASQSPKIDLVPGNAHTIVLSENEMKMPPSVKSLVKAVRTSTADRSKPFSKNTVVSVKVGAKPSVAASLGNTIVIPSSKLAGLGKQTVVSKGTAGGKYIIVQSPSGQQSRLTLAPHSSADKPVAGSSSAGKVVILTKPQTQQKTSTQRIVTSSGQILTPVNPRTRMPVGTKLTPITGQQMRLVSPAGAKLVSPAGAKLTMQSLHTKVCLPSMQSIRQPVRVVKPATGSSTILIQAPQTSTLLNPTAIRPRLLKSPMTVIPSGKPVRTSVAHPKILHSRSTLQPRMLIQPSPAVQQVMKIVPQPRKTVSLQPVQRMPMARAKPLQLGPRPIASTPKPPLQKVSRITSTASSHVPSSSTVELLTSQSLPMLSPLPVSNFSSVDSVLTSDQLAQVMASTSANQLSDAGATYVLLTIDDAGNLQQLNNQTLIGYDGSDQTGQTFYIDPSSLETAGDLNNMILTIDNTTLQSDAGLSSDWIPSTSQDILAAALANTDVFQSEQEPLPSCVVDTSSLLSSIPSTILLPSLNRVVATAANVSETSLTLNQPIMSPLEVTSAVTSFRVPPLATCHVPAPLYTGAVSEPLLIQPIMSPMEVTSNVVPAFHPSMPLLSEEPNTGLTASSEQTTQEYAKLAQEEDVHLTQFSNQLLDQNGHVLSVATDANERVDDVPSFEQSVGESPHPEVPSLESDLGSDMLQTFLPNESESLITDSNAIPHSMPLLSDDPVSSQPPADPGNNEGNVTGIDRDFQECGTSEIVHDPSEV